MLEFFKVLVQPVVLVRDEEGHIIDERLGQTTAFYLEQQVVEYFAAIKAEIEKVNEQETGEQ